MRKLPYRGITSINLGKGEKSLQGLSTSSNICFTSHVASVKTRPHGSLAKRAYNSPIRLLGMGDGNSV